MMVLEDGDRARQVSLNNRGNYHTASGAQVPRQLSHQRGSAEVARHPAAAETRAARLRDQSRASSPSARPTKRSDRSSATRRSVPIRSRSARSPPTCPWPTPPRPTRRSASTCCPSSTSDPVHSTTRQREAQLGAAGGLSPTMHIGDSPEEAAFRAEARGWLEQHARAPRSDEAAQAVDHRRRAGSALAGVPSLAARALRRRLGRHHLAEAVRRPRRPTVAGGDLRRGAEPSSTSTTGAFVGGPRHGRRRR